MTSFLTAVRSLNPLIVSQRARRSTQAIAMAFIAAMSANCGAARAEHETVADAGKVLDVDGGALPVADAGQTTTDAGPTAVSDAGEVVKADGGRAPDTMLSDADRALVTARPFRVTTPVVVSATPHPLVLLVHGFGVDGAFQDAYFKLSAAANARDMIVATPDGVLNSTGSRYWNATDACCNIFNENAPDDVAYLRAIINDLSSRYPIDPQRIYVMGHSNGGFMAHRLACELSDRVAAIAELAGGQHTDTTYCKPDHRVSVLHIHGTADLLISYNGGILVSGKTYPSAETTVRTWASLNGCSTTAPRVIGAAFDAEVALFGNDTTPESFTACPPGIDVVLWKINFGAHVPLLQDSFTPKVLDFLMAHPKVN